ncbi:hypothetical protein T459_27473 [Capsicum annuum]|uniref:Pyruvate dehydrogenase E1 component subunit beta n=1 Tax=Capsicum annuum TaxID=4072 RepID=A0A2G2YE20_CAPAN|nr:hypothetical protein T459_27473 [Capsicum annuum]
MDARSLMSLMAIDHIINSTAKSNYMSAGQISVPIIFRGPNDAAARVGAQHSQGLTYPVAELFLEDVFEKKIRNLRLAAILRKSHAAHCIDLITSSDKFIVLRPVQLYVFQIARREGLSLWQELFPTLVSVSNKGPAQEHCDSSFMGKLSNDGNTFISKYPR